MNKILPPKRWLLAGVIAGTCLGWYGYFGGWVAELPGNVLDILEVMFEQGGRPVEALMRMLDVPLNDPSVLGFCLVMGYFLIFWGVVGSVVGVAVAAVSWWLWRAVRWVTAMSRRREERQRTNIEELDAMSGRRGETTKDGNVDEGKGKHG